MVPRGRNLKKWERAAKKRWLQKAGQDRRIKGTDAGGTRGLKLEKRQPRGPVGRGGKEECKRPFTCIKALAKVGGKQHEGKKKTRGHVGTFGREGNDRGVKAEVGWVGGAEINLARIGGPRCNNPGGRESLKSGEKMG